MLQKIILFFDKLLYSILLRYRKYAFLSRIKSSKNNLRVLGVCSVERAANVQIGDDLTIYPNVSFSGSGKIIIGNNVQIGEGTIIYSHTLVQIGDNVAIAGQCYIIDCNHGTKLGIKMQDQPLYTDENGIFIGCDVWIGAGSKIIKGANIADGVVIGAQSLVNSHIEENSIAVGIPAKVVRLRE